MSDFSSARQTDRTDSIRRSERTSLLSSASSASKAVSEKFEITIDAASNEKGLNFDSAIGQNCTITVETLEQRQALLRRYLDRGALAWRRRRRTNTPISSCCGRGCGCSSFRRNTLIFHEKTVPEIIEEMFGNHGFANFSNNLSRGYPTLEYCVQYRESDMDFVCRLMEEYGISYYFKHSDGEHKLILSRRDVDLRDHSRRQPAVPSDPTASTMPNKEYFFSWEPEATLHLGQDQARRLRLQEVDRPISRAEDIDPPFRARHARGVRLSRPLRGKGRRPEDRAGMARHGTGQRRPFPRRRRLRHLLPGRAGHAGGQERQRPRRRVSGAALCPHASATRPIAAAPGRRKSAYRGQVRVRQERQDLRAAARYAESRRCRARRRPRSSAKATSTSTNTGASWCASTGIRKRTSPPLPRRAGMGRQAMGRHLHSARRHGSASCTFWRATRTSRWSIGCVYNDKHMPPYDLPGDKTHLRRQVQSTPSGNGFNEFIFDDEDGSELVRLHAQKDLEFGHRERRNRARSRRTARPRSATTIRWTSRHAEDRRRQMLKITPARRSS